MRTSLQTAALSDPRLSNPTKMRKKCCYGRRRTWGQYSSLSPSPAHLSHTTTITLSRIKFEKLYFYKEVCSFVDWSSYIMFDYVSACICIMVIKQFNPSSSHTKDSKKWYLIPLCLTLSIINYGSRVNWNNPGKGGALSPTRRCCSFWKSSLRSHSNRVANTFINHLFVLWELVISIAIEH